VGITRVCHVSRLKWGEGRLGAWNLRRHRNEADEDIRGSDRQGRKSVAFAPSRFLREAHPATASLTPRTQGAPRYVSAVCWFPSPTKANSKVRHSFSNFGQALSNSLKWNGQYTCDSTAPPLHSLQREGRTVRRRRLGEGRSIALSTPTRWLGGPNAHTTSGPPFVYSACSACSAG